MRTVASQPRLDVGKLKDERVAGEFVNWPSMDLGGLGVSEDLEELWSVFKATSLMLPVDVLESTKRRRRTLFHKRHWISLISHRASKMAELSC